jgi:hypothetical protein
LLELALELVLVLVLVLVLGWSPLSHPPTVAGLNAAVTPAGRPDNTRFTAPVNAPVRATVTVTVPVPLRATLTAALLLVIVKPPAGGGGGFVVPPLSPPPQPVAIAHRSRDPAIVRKRALASTERMSCICRGTQVVR